MKFYVKDCPHDQTLFQWISEQTDMSAAINDVTCQVDGTQVLSVPHKLDIRKLAKDTLDCLDAYGFKGWRTQRGDANSYGGLSMVYNPDGDSDPNQSTLGTRENAPEEFFYGSTQRFDSIRNTYFDSYAFRKLAPCIEQSNLKNFIEGFKLSPTRSRIAVLDASYRDKVGEEFLWHKDETVFENLRLNIPIETDQSFLFQLEDQEPFHLAVGKIYTWDTHRAHRVYASETKSVKRVHLVLGFSPWIDYDPIDDSFSTNEHFGRTHPFDLFFKGLAHPMIGHL